MKMALQKLLEHRQIAHPTRVDAVRFMSNRRLVFSLSGYRWWSATADHHDEGSVELIFGNVEQGKFDLSGGEPDEALEDFELREVAGTEWASGEMSEIYCSAPLPDTWRLYCEVHDYLWRGDIPLDAERFLNFPFPCLIGDFARITQSESYLVCRAPPSLAKEVERFLRNHEVPYNCLFNKGARPLPRLIVRLNNSCFFCDTAEIEFDDSDVS